MAILTMTASPTPPLAQALPHVSHASLTLSEAADRLGVSEKLIRKWIKTGRLQGTKDHRWAIPEEPILALNERQAEMRHWPRLVDVSRELEIHRNHGESLCRRAGLPIEKDFSDDYRIPPKAVAYLRSRVVEQHERQDWISLRAFARELELPANVLDGGLRKLGLEFAHNLSGQVIFPVETCRKLRDWRAAVAEGKRPVLVDGGERLFKLRRTAEESAAFFAAPGSQDHTAKVRTLTARYRFWIQRGLPSVRMGRTNYFTEEVHRILLDEISLSEAAKFANVARNTIKGWAQRKWLPTLEVAPTRRSYSRSGLITLLRRRFRTEGKLRARTHVPVRLLSPVSELTDELGTNETTLSRILRLVGGATPNDLETLAVGQGSISRGIWLTLEQWRDDLAEGKRPSWSGIQSAPESIAPGLLLAENLPEVLTFFSEVPREQLEKLFPRRFAENFTRLEMMDLFRQVCRHQGRLRVYDPPGNFEVGELLLDRYAHDVGTVSQLVDGATMEVDWVRRGKLRVVSR